MGCYHVAILLKMFYSYFCSQETVTQTKIASGSQTINYKVRHDYNNRNFPIATLADVSTDLAGKKNFAKQECSQAYYVVQMAVAFSVQ